MPEDANLNKPERKVENTITSLLEKNWKYDGIEIITNVLVTDCNEEQQQQQQQLDSQQAEEKCQRRRKKGLRRRNKQNSSRELQQIDDDMVCTHMSLTLPLGGGIIDDTEVLEDAIQLTKDSIDSVNLQKY